MPRPRIKKTAPTPPRARKQRRAERRIGGADSSTRAALLDAAEKLMRREGYAAVTSRKLAYVAKLTPQLVHYYFRTMDDLFLALWQRFVENNMKRHADALGSAQPLRAMWDMFRKSSDVVLEVEFMALSHHRKAIRSRVARDGDMFRDMQVKLLAKAMSNYQFEGRTLAADIITVVLTSIARSVVLEQDIGMTGGLANTLQAVETWLDRLERQAARSKKAQVSAPRSQATRR